MDAGGVSTDMPAKAGPGRPRPLRRLLVLLFLAVVGFVVYILVKPEPPVIEAITPDGKFKVRFVHGGIGKIDYHPDSDVYVWFYDVARDWAPVILFNKLPKPRNVFQQGAPTPHGAERLMVMFDVKRAAGASRDAPLHEALDNVAFIFEESTGASLEQNYSGKSIGFGHTLSFNVFPRRDRTIKLHMVEKGSRRPWMLVTIPNEKPSTNQFAQKPGPVPMVVTTPEVRATLSEVKIGATGLVIPILDVEPVPGGWTNYLLNLSLEDATGNEGERLSPFESCWKVVVKVFRTIDEQFAPAEMWQSPAFAVPGKKSATTLGSEGRVDSTSIRLLCVKGPGPGMVHEALGQWSFSEKPVISDVKLPVPGGKPGQTTFYAIHMPHTEQPFVLLDINDIAADDQVMVFVRDQNGAALGKASDPPTRYMERARCRCAVQFTPLESTKEVTATVIISKPKVIEFFVGPPPELRANYAKAVLK